MFKEDIPFSDKILESAYQRIIGTFPNKTPTDHFGLRALFLAGTQAEMEHQLEEMIREHAQHHDPH